MFICETLNVDKFYDDTIELYFIYYCFVFHDFRNISKKITNKLPILQCFEKVESQK